MTGDEIQQVLGIDTQREQLRRSGVTQAIGALDTQSQIRAREAQTETENALRQGRVEQFQTGNTLTTERVNDLRAFRSHKIDSLLANTAGQKVINELNSFKIEEGKALLDPRIALTEAQVKRTHALAAISRLNAEELKAIVPFASEAKRAQIALISAQAENFSANKDATRQITPLRAQALEYANELAAQTNLYTVNQARLKTEWTQAQLNELEKQIGQYVEVEVYPGVTGQVRVADIMKQQAALNKAGRTDELAQAREQRARDIAAAKRLSAADRAENVIHSKDPGESKGQAVEIFNRNASTPYGYEIQKDYGSPFDLGLFGSSLQPQRIDLPKIPPGIIPNFQGQLKAREAQALIEGKDPGESKGQTNVIHRIPGVETMSQLVEFLRQKGVK